jgi:hypothetical protein
MHTLKDRGCWWELLFEAVLVNSCSWNRNLSCIEKNPLIDWSEGVYSWYTSTNTVEKTLTVQSPRLSSLVTRKLRIGVLSLIHTANGVFRLSSRCDRTLHCTGFSCLNLWSCISWWLWNKLSSNLPFWQTDSLCMSGVFDHLVGQVLQSHHSWLIESTISNGHKNQSQLVWPQISGAFVVTDEHRSLLSMCWLSLYPHTQPATAQPLILFPA